MDELRNFNEIFREDVTYHNIKNHKKPVYPLSKRCIFGKPQKGECRIDPTPLIHSKLFKG